jgi:hypothetical protein
VAGVGGACASGFGLWAAVAVGDCWGWIVLMLASAAALVSRFSMLKIEKSNEGALDATGTPALLFLTHAKEENSVRGAALSGEGRRRLRFAPLSCKNGGWGWGWTRGQSDAELCRCSFFN